MTVPPIDLFVQLRQLNLKRDIISSKKITLVLSVTYDIHYNRRQRKLVDLLDTFSCLHVKIHVIIVNVQLLHAGFW